MTADPDSPTSITDSERFAPKLVKRRDFLGIAALWSFITTVGLMIIGALRLPMPSVFPELGTKFRIGPPERFPKGSATIIAGRNILVMHDELGIRVLSLICTHLGCIVSHEGQEGFICPCHGTRFDSEGAIVQGPAPSGLRSFQTTYAPNGEIVVDSGSEVDASFRLTAMEQVS